MKLKPGLPWRSQDVGDARVMGCLLRKADNREWNQPKRKKWLRSTKLSRVGDLKRALTSDMEMQFGVCPGGFRSCFGPVFPHYIPLPCILEW